MRSLEEMLKQLSPPRQAEVIDFIEFLLTKEPRPARPKMTCDWEGGLQGLRDQYMSVELQRKASGWRLADETPD